MTVEHKDRVKDTTSTEGLLDFVIDGTTVTGYRTVTSAHTDGATVHYLAGLTTGAEWEVGEGVWTVATNTVTRVTIYASSNSGSKVAFSAGSKIFATVAAAADFTAGGSGDVVGPASAVNSNVALFDGTTGKLIKDSGLALSSYATTAAVAAGYQPLDSDLTTWAGVTPGTGVATALAVNVGTAGAPVINGGVLGTPSSGDLSNCTGFPTSPAFTAFV